MKLSKRNKRILEVLDKKISFLHKLLDNVETEIDKKSYINQAYAFRVCMLLICENGYLEKLEELLK